jgi:CubicO group peptidase (beta-lactamase class C family)
MRTMFVLAAVVGCSSPAPKTQHPTVAPAPAVQAPAVTPKEASVSAPAVAKETVKTDTPRTTVAGNGFVVPAGWSVWTKEVATIVEAPEADSWIALVDVKAPSAEDAVALAWAAYKPDHKRPVEMSIAAPDHDGWSRNKRFAYKTSPNEKRNIGAIAMYANDTWTVAIIDIADATGEKRGSQLGVVFGRLLPKGGARESFAGRKPHPLDKEHLAQLTKFVEDSMQTLGVPGVGLGIIENGKVVFAGGFGVRQLGKPAKIDANTKFMIASNTKALTTLMLAKLVDEKKLTWETAATSLLPEFKLGDADTTSKVQVKHLICACTGMPRQDMEMFFEFKGATPASAMNVLGTMQPTSKFGELFQYSNPLAAAAGFIGGHVAFPKLELGRAYDEAMRTRVFAPLGMKATTFDYKKAQTGNVALPHSPDLDGKMTHALHALNDMVIPVRPAGAAWSTIADMLQYVKLELAEGALPNGKPYITKEALLARRSPQVAIGSDKVYGMGLMVDNTYGVTVVHHGGDLIGYHSDMMWLPELGIGAVVLTNGDYGSTIRGQFQRKLLEVLFDGKPEADARVQAAKKSIDESVALAKKDLVIPPDGAAVGKLAARYKSSALGDLTVIKEGTKVVFDVGEWKTEVATKKNPDGTVSFIAISPSVTGFELVVGTAAGKRTLVLRDAQHEYLFTEV